MVGLHFTALLTLLCSLHNYVVFVGGGPGQGSFSQFFHTAAGLPVTAVDFLLQFLAILRSH